MSNEGDFQHLTISSFASKNILFNLSITQTVPDQVTSVCCSPNKIEMHTGVSRYRKQPFAQNIISLQNGGKPGHMEIHSHSTVVLTWLWQRGRICTAGSTLKRCSLAL